MGTWATEMRGSDEALDAVDTYEDRLPTFKRDAPSLRRFLTTVHRRFGRLGILGVAEAMLEQGIDLRGQQSFLKQFITKELSPAVLADWESHQSLRKRSLERFAERLAEKPKPPKPKKAPKKRAFRVPPAYEAGKSYPFINETEPEPGEFSKEGLIPWRMGEREGYIDRHYKIVIPPIFMGTHRFQNGRAVVFVDEIQNFGVIDPQGRWILPPDGRYISDFKEGRAIIFDERGGSRRYGFIDPNGHIVVPLIYLDAKSFSNGMAAVQGKKGYGYVNREGKLVIPCTLRSAEAFKRGTARARDHKNRWGRMDREGRWVEKPVATEIKFSAKGWLPAEIKGRWGYQDSQGRLMIKPRFSDADAFQKDLARVSLGTGPRRRFGMINKKGYIVVPIRYTIIYPFSGEWAPAELNGKSGQINRRGKFYGK